MTREELVNFICQDEGHTVLEAANHFHVSVSTIKKKLSQIRDKTREDYNPILAEKLKLAQDKITLRGQIKGGSIGKRGRTLSEEQIRMYAEAFLSSGLTLQDFADLSGIPKSTLYDMIRSIKDVELQARIDDKVTRKELKEDVTWRK